MIFFFMQFCFQFKWAQLIADSMSDQPAARPTKPVNLLRSFLVLFFRDDLDLVQSSWQANQIIIN